MSKKHFLPPVAIHFVWHKDDSLHLAPFLDEVRKEFTRNIDRPFSRSLNLPLYFYNTEGISIDTELDIPQAKGQKDIIFIFLSTDFVGDISGITYLRKLSRLKLLVPIWLTDDVGQTGISSIDNTNALRFYDFTGKQQHKWWLLLLAHEIYRHGFSVRAGKDKRLGKETSLRLFISHTKKDDNGKIVAEKIRDFIEKTNLDEFYDKTEISPGFRFRREILKNIELSSIIAIRTDHYSARRWCQREIAKAKESARPIVIMDMLSTYEDRYFPALANVPSIHVKDKISEGIILKVLLQAILETIRSKFFLKAVETFWSHTANWLKNRKPLIRPPEIRVVADILRSEQKHKGLKVCYPEPPVYAEEHQWYDTVRLDAVTPLWNPKLEEHVLAGLKVGISASDPDMNDFSHFHMHENQLQRLEQDLARNILIRGGQLVYGGDMRPGGVTEFLLTEAVDLRSHTSNRVTILPIVNYLAWPIYVPNDEKKKWRNRFNHIMKTEEVPVPTHLHSLININRFLAPTTTENKWIWAECLTEMRSRMNKGCHVRICVGGKRAHYKGRMPGVLEEILMAVNSQKPLLLLGGFGGVVKDLCDFLSSESINISTLTEKWQVEHNVGYGELLSLLRRNGNDVDYAGVLQKIKAIGINGLASRCHMNVRTYRHLMESEYVDECVMIVNKTLKHLNSMRKTGNKR